MYLQDVILGNTAWKRADTYTDTPPFLPSLPFRTVCLLPQSRTRGFVVYCLLSTISLFGKNDLEPISRWNFYNMKNISGASEFHFWQLLIKIQNTALRWQSLLFFYFSDPQILTALRKEERKGGIFCRLRPRTTPSSFSSWMECTFISSSISKSQKPTRKRREKSREDCWR